MINSRDINELHPAVKKRCQQFIERCWQQLGISVLIICTYRDDECQAALYAKGRTQPGRIITQARPGESFHNYRLAFDFAPIVNGKIDWQDLESFKKCGAIAQSVGLEWGGSWTFKDYGHCQFSGGLSLQALQQGAQLPCS